MVENCCDFPKSFDTPDPYLQAIELNAAADHAYPLALLTTANYANAAGILFNLDTALKTRFFNIHNAACASSTYYVFSIIEELTDTSLSGSITGVDGATHTYASLIEYDATSGAFSVSVDPFTGPFDKNIRIKMLCSSCPTIM